MSDLTEIIPATINQIEAHYESVNVPRTRLGLSQAGHSCKRLLWYAHHEYVALQPSGRVLRLFQLGNLLEEQIIKDLMDCGICHHSCQKQVVFNNETTTLTGSIDGIVLGLPESPKTPHLFESKTASNKRFKELIKKGSYKEWDSTYWYQVQFYMLGLNLERAAVFVYNKDTSELYMERIKLDKEATVAKLVDVFSAIEQENPPDRECPSGSWYKAKFCNFRNVCYPEIYGGE